MSLERLISQLPQYMRDSNDEVHVLTIQPAVLADQHSCAHQRWMVGYLRLSDGINWLYQCSGETIGKAVYELRKLLIAERHCSECQHYEAINCQMYCKTLQKGITARKRPCKFYQMKI